MQISRPSSSLPSGVFGEFLVHDGSAGDFINDPNFASLFDDFRNTTGAGETGWRNTTNSGTILMTTGEAGRPGVVVLSTSTSATASPVIDRQTNSILFGGGRHVFELAIKLSNLSDGTDTYTVRIGFHDGATPVDGAWFEYTHSVNTGKWEIKTSNNSVVTTADSGVAADTNWTKLRIEVNAAGTSVEYFINGTSVGTISTNIPTAAGRETGVAFRIIKSVGTTQRTMSVDYTLEQFKPTAAR